MGAAGQITFRAMFGEYALYCGGKVVALVCDDRVFLKPTAAAQTLVGAVEQAPPYPGAKPHWVIDALLDDAETLAQLIHTTADALPMPKPKKPRAQKRAKKEPSGGA